LTMKICISMSLLFFFFQAEDGIRDRNVTGVQTCALPILSSSTSFAFVPSLNIVRQYGHALEIIDDSVSIACSVRATLIRFPVVRSEERRVGKECSGWGWQ